MGFSSHAVQIELFRHGELFASSLHESGPLTVGPSPGAAVPTTALEHTISLLVPLRQGFGVRLAAGLEGVLQVGQRRLRVAQGLLHDPRPEPLVLRDGDQGQLQLDAAVQLRFHVVRRQRRFRAVPRLDRGLAAGLGVGLALATTVLVVVAPWRPQQPRKIPAQKLTRNTPAVTRLVHVAQGPRPPAANKRDKTRTKDRAARPRQHARRSAARPSAARGSRRPKASKPLLERGVLGLLRKARQRHPGLFAAAGQAQPEKDPLLSRLDAALTSMGSARSGAMGGRPGAGAVDPLGGLLDEPAPGPTTGAGLPRAHRLPRGPGAPRAAGRPAPDQHPSREAIRKVVQAGGSQVRLCYERELITAGEPRSGRIVLRWLVGPNGRAQQLRVVKDTIGSSSLRACVTARVRSWSFPPCQQGCSVVYPFEFSARK